MNKKDFEFTSSFDRHKALADLAGIKYSRVDYKGLLDNPPEKYEVEMKVETDEYGASFSSKVDLCFYLRSPLGIAALAKVVGQKFLIQQVGNTDFWTISDPEMRFKYKLGIKDGKHQLSTDTVPETDMVRSYDIAVITAALKMIGTKRVESLTNG